MTLTRGTGPFAKPERAGERFNFPVDSPKHVLYLEDSPRRIRVAFGQQTIADSHSAKMLHETGHLPLYYIPQRDVRMDLLRPTDHRTHCPFKGDASYWTVQVGALVAENAVWSYPDPLQAAPPLAGHLAFEWNAMDAWFEEDEESVKRTLCPYKGHASYWSVQRASAVADDLAWCYEEPLAEALKVAGYVCFPQEHADVEIDAS